MQLPYVLTSGTVITVKSRYKKPRYQKPRYKKPLGTRNGASVPVEFVWENIAISRFLEPALSNTYSFLYRGCGWLLESHMLPRIVNCFLIRSYQN